MTTITIERALLEQILNDVCGAKLCEVNSMSSRADQTMTDKFKRWFAGSKVVDADGKPLVVYHGTDQKFTEFKYGEFGFHFGNKEQAESRGDVLMPVYLSIKNPIHFDTDFSSWNEEEIAPYLVKKKIITRKEAGLGDLQGLLMEKGYDGYLYENGYEGGGTSYAVFSPEQIKSAIGNNGDFDPKNPDIRFSRAEVRRLMGSAANAIRAALAPPATAPATAPEKTVKEIMEFVRHYAANTFSSATLEDKIRRSLAAPATAPEERVKELEAELAATETVITEYRQQCLDNAAEIARLRKLIADHVNSSNNDDSVGDTFGALLAEVQPKHKPKPFIGTRSAIYKCTDCGHEQSVQEIHTEYGVYVGSGANWCDKCGDGKPERKETP